MEFFGVVLGWLLGIVSLVVAELIRDYFSKRSLKAQQEYSERIVKMQLFVWTEKFFLNLAATY